MSAFTGFSLGIVTENQNRIQKAEKLASILVEHLPAVRNFDIQKYNKLPGSYRIELEGIFQTQNHIKESIQITDSICSPWMVMYDRDSTNIELIFNTSESGQFEFKEFNVIRWAHFQVIIG